MNVRIENRISRNVSFNKHKRNEEKCKWHGSQREEKQSGEGFPKRPSCVYRQRGGR